MRTSGICPKCNHDHTLIVDRVADAVGDFGGDERPMRLALVHTGTGWLGDEKTARAGQLSAVVCRTCGFTELYVKDPQAIPADGEHIIERKPGDAPPFR